MWQYTLRPETPTPPCPLCRNLSGVVKLKRDVYVCMECLPREAWEARWVEEPEREEQTA